MATAEAPIQIPELWAAGLFGVMSVLVVINEASG
jgi:hypothetical protein